MLAWILAINYTHNISPFLLPSPFLQLLSCSVLLILARSGRFRGIFYETAGQGVEMLYL